MTAYPKKNQGAIVFLAMRGKAKDHVFNMDLGKFESVDGFEEILKVLDEIYIPEVFEKKYRNFNDLWNFYRKPDDPVAEWSAD